MNIPVLVSAYTTPFCIKFTTFLMKTKISNKHLGTQRSRCQFIKYGHLWKIFHYECFKECFKIHYFQKDILSKLLELEHKRLKIKQLNWTNAMSTLTFHVLQIYTMLWHTCVAYFYLTSYYCTCRQISILLNYGKYLYKESWSRIACY